MVGQREIDIAVLLRLVWMKLGFKTMGEGEALVTLTEENLECRMKSEELWSEKEESRGHSEQRGDDQMSINSLSLSQIVFI